MRGMPAQGQLWGVRPLPKRQEPPDLQAAPLREAHREEGKSAHWFSILRSCPTESKYESGGEYPTDSFTGSAKVTQ